MAGKERQATREAVLGLYVSAKRLKKAWTRTVRQGLRRQPTSDLVDFQDIHIDIDGFVQDLESRVLRCQYVPRPPHLVVYEKKLGIPRRIAVPNVEEALLLQCLSDAMEPLLAESHRKNAFYSRSNDGNSISSLDDSFAYPWWHLWPQFQRRILNFTKSHKILVSTDVANYYDTISLSLLRNRVSALSDVGEPTLDLLFSILDVFQWQSDYSPRASTGLPQLSFDAPRLLAHCFLFDVDDLLLSRANGDYVRWMDDVDFGVQSVDQASSILQELEGVLAASSLHLNVGKTKMMRPEEALLHFQADENRHLTVLNNALKTSAGSPRRKRGIRNHARRRLVKFLPNRQGQWDKVMKRYLSLLGTLYDPSLQPHLEGLLFDFPSLRESVFKYLLRFGYSADRLPILEGFFFSTVKREDAGTFFAARLATQWTLPVGVVNSLIPRAVDALLQNPCPTNTHAALLMAAKYGTPRNIETVINETLDIWQSSDWLSRQVAGAASRLSVAAWRPYEAVMARRGLTEGIRVFHYLDFLLREVRLPRSALEYMSHKPTPPLPYDLGRALCARLVFQRRDSYSVKAADGVFAATTDHWYRNWVSS